MGVQDEPDDVTASLLRRAQEAALATRCAWCGRYRIRGAWVVAAPDGVADPAESSHGICDDCVRALRESGKSI